MMIPQVGRKCNRGEQEISVGKKRILEKNGLSAALQGYGQLLLINQLVSEL